MDRAEFQRHLDIVLQEAERVRTYCTQDEIVLIMTGDFYRELLATIDIHANRDGDHYGFLYGYRIALINEPTEHTMVSPAVLGMTYHPGMALDDIIVVDEENRVFRLAQLDPVQFEDTGMTVRFDAHTRTTRLDAAAIDAGNIAAETMRVATAQAAATTATVNPYTAYYAPAETTTTATDNYWQRYWTNPVAWDYNPTVTFHVDEAEVNHSVFDMLTGGGKRKKSRIREDKELSAGDTKAMDEFLDGFAIKQNLQQA